MGKHLVMWLFGDHPFYKYAQYILQFDKLALGLLLVPYQGYVDNICSCLPRKSSRDNIKSHDTHVEKTHPNCGLCHLAMGWAIRRKLSVAFTSPYFLTGDNVAISCLMLRLW